MTLKDQITEDMKSAMRAKETARLSAIRLLLQPLSSAKLMSALWWMMQA
jgi:uncharacterized protein YqeY